MKKLKVNLLLILIFSSKWLCAQEVLRVASKEEQKTFQFEKGDTLRINAEKAHLTIEKWDRNYVELTIIKQSKHKDGRIAVEEIEYLHFKLEKNDNVIQFHNYFLPPDKYKKVQGLLSILLKIKTPESLSLDIQNSFGSISISQLDSHISLSNRFVETMIEQCNGEIFLTSFFGTNHIKEYHGNFNFDLERTEMSITRMNGSVKGSSQFGKITLSSLDISDLQIDSEHSEIELQFKSDLKSYNFDLKTTFSKVHVNGVVYKNEWIQKYSNSLPQVRVKTSYSPINILTQNHE